MDITFEIKQHIGVLSENEKTGWKRELNLVSWNGYPVKWDIRDWNDDHTKFGKGKSFTTEEMQELKNLLNSRVEL